MCDTFGQERARVSLRAAFRDYLRDMSGPHRVALVRGLAEHGYATEAMLLERYFAHGPGAYPVSDGAWAGRTAHVGPRLPAGDAGDLWLDTCEIALMILLARVPRNPAEPPPSRDDGSPFLAWMSLRPVARWQLGAFLDVAPLEPVEQRYTPPRTLLDPRRLLAGPETSAITRLTCDEADPYCFWFGKGMTGQREWQAARRLLGTAPWGDPAREWAGESDFNGSLYVAISPATIDIDPKETLDTDDPQLRMLYYDFEFETPEDVTFRTSVCMQRGLELAQVAMAPGRLPARVAGRLVRPETGAEDLKACHRGNGET